jgi:archaellum component FlaF (FlaF/FlaG flagellin family)
MDQEKQRRVASMIMAELRKEQKQSKGMSPIKIKRMTKKRFVAVLLAATLLFGMTAYGAEKNEWDIAIVNYMGINNADTAQLEGGEVEIGASDSSNGVTFQAVTSVGDKNSTYIRIDTDYRLPVSFNQKTDYILPENYTINIKGKPYQPVADYGATFGYYDNNGMLSFMMLISNCDGINKKKITISMSDLYLYHDLNANEKDKVAEKSLVCKGEWTLSWKYYYRSNVKTYYPIRLVESSGNTCLVTKLEISPISIRAQGVKNPHEGSTERSLLLIDKITMKDGSVIEFDPNSTSGGCKNNTFLNGYRDVLEMHRAITPSEVHSVTIGDTEIVL